MKKTRMTLDEAVTFRTAYLADETRHARNDQAEYAMYWDACSVINRAEDAARKATRLAAKAARLAAREAKSAAKRERCTREQTRGTCQVCGRDVAVDANGVTSAHGYRVQWGTFNGACMGANKPAYEIGHDVLDEFIAMLFARRVALVTKRTSFEMGRVVKFVSSRSRTQTWTIAADFPKVISANFTDTFQRHVDLEVEAITADLRSHDYHAAQYDAHRAAWVDQSDRAWRVVLVEA